MLLLQLNWGSDDDFAGLAGGYSMWGAAAGLGGNESWLCWFAVGEVGKSDAAGLLPVGQAR